MKKNILMVFIIGFLVCFGWTSKVDAVHTHSSAESELAAGSGVLLCEYYSSTMGDGTRIYYYFQREYAREGSPNDYKVQNAYWDVFASKKNGSWTWLDSGAGYSYGTYGTFSQVFTGGRIHYNSTNQRLTDENNFSCPQYAFLDTDGYWEICIGNSTDCGNKFDRGKQELKTNANTLFNVINAYAENGVYEEITLQELQASNVLNIVKAKTVNYVKLKYFNSGEYVYPAFITNYINNLNYNIDVTNTSSYEKFQDTMSEQIDQAEQNGDITSEEAENLREEISKTFASSMNVVTTPSITPSEEDSCNAILTPTLAKVVQNILKFVQYLGPVLVIVLTIVDFVKAALSGEQDAIKKASQKFMKRIIAAILLFFVPLLVNIIFNFTGIVPPSSCFE